MERVKIYWKRRDQWVGRYYDDEYNYVCLIPCLVIRWRRK